MTAVEGKIVRACGAVRWCAALVPLLMAACASTPMGPTAQVLPAPNKPFEVFQQDQVGCKQYAQSQVAGQADAANKQAVGAGVLGTVLGGALGAAAGGHQGAAVGAAGGAMFGAAAGTGASARGQGSIQAQYDNAYVQCMYAKGNQVPGMQPAMAAGSPPPPPVAAVVDEAASPPASAAPGTPADPGAGAAATMTLAQAQAKLNAMGFTVGRPDGVMGRKTKEQLTLFQKSRGIAETGELDAATIAELNN